MQYTLIQIQCMYIYDFGCRDWLLVLITYDNLKMFYDKLHKLTYNNHKKILQQLKIT